MQVPAPAAGVVLMCLAFTIGCSSSADSGSGAPSKGQDLPAAAASVSATGKDVGMSLESDSGSFKALTQLAKEPAPSIITKDYRPTDVPSGPAIAGCGHDLQTDLSWSWAGHEWSELLIDLTSPANFQRPTDASGLPLANEPTVAQKRFERFADQQQQNQVVFTSYRNCWLNDRTSFLEGLAGAASGATAATTYTWTGIKLNLDWQWAHQKPLIKEAQAAFSDTAGVAPRARGMGWLLKGQRHNAPMQMAYRAAFRDDPTKLIEIVKGYH